MKRLFNKTFLLLFICIALFIGIRSLHYVYQVNWSGDQAFCGIEALNIFKNKIITFIGPQISANYEGRYIFQGPIIYYMYLFFLLLGKWDPVPSSYYFMIFCAFMIIPLFFGIKKLLNEKAAWIMVIIYSFYPYYINYTRFLWNSTFLFSLLPLLIFFMGIYQEKRYKKPWLFFLISFWLGLLLQFHYQFIIIIIGIFTYYFLVRKIKPINLLVFFGGIMLGFSPLIIFELRHQFYHIRTILLFIQHWDKVDKPGGINMPHYYISISFMLLVLILSLISKKINKIKYYLIIIFGLIVFLYGFTSNLQKPIHAFWAPTTPWNYLDEKHIYEIIKSTNLKNNFNVANLAYYDTLSVVVKYFMKRDGYDINYDDYYHNKYLFVISEKDKYLSSPSYEVATFKPHVVLKQWKINTRFNMVLLERLNK